jgi:hypothetical protein
MRLLLLLLLVACGDNIRPTGGSGPFDPSDELRPDAREPTRPTREPEDTGPFEPPPSEPTEPTQPTKSACCIGAMNGMIPHECAPPPGTCKFDSTCGDGIVLYICTR